MAATTAYLKTRLQILRGDLMKSHRLGAEPFRKELQAKLVTEISTTEAEIGRRYRRHSKPWRPGA